MKRHIQIADLIVRLIRNESLAAEELEELDAWVAECDANRDLFISLCQEETFEKKWKAYEEWNTGKAFERMKRRREQFHRRRVRWYSTVAAVAALMIVFLGVTRLWQAEPELPSAPTSSIAAGSSRAWLTLESGKRLSLGYADTLVWQKPDYRLSGDSGKLSYHRRAGQVNPGKRYNILETPRGGEFRLALADGTEVWLNAGSRLKYPVIFEDSTREVELEGEAYFKVRKDSLHPFRVHTNRSVVTVLGTEFCIRAYIGELNRTTLVSGKVKVDNSEGKTLTLVPGQQACIGDQQMEMKEVDPYYYTAWKDGYFLFDEAPLEKIMADLAQWYDFEYFFVNQKTAGLRLSARLEKYDEIGKVLEILAKTGEIRFSCQGKAILVWDNK